MMNHTPAAPFTYTYGPNRLTLLVTNNSTGRTRRLYLNDNGTYSRKAR